MNHTSFPIEIKGNELCFGNDRIPLKYWEGFWITKNKTYRVELYCHQRVENTWYKTVLRVHCETEELWQRCSQVLSKTALNNSSGKSYPIDSYEHAREYNLTKEGIYEIYKSIKLPVDFHEIVKWIEDPVSLMGKQGEKCSHYLKGQIERAYKEENNKKVADLIGSAATIPDFNFLELLSLERKNSRQLPDSKS